MEKKYCATCKKHKHVEEFNKNKSKPDGLNSICRKCSNKHSKLYYKINNEKIKKQIHESRRKRIEENRNKIYEYYITHPCVDCGECDPVVLEFDHVKGKKWKNISLLVSDGSSWNIIKKEIKKCDVRCANCHRRKTAKDYGWYSYVKHTPS